MGPNHSILVSFGSIFGLSYFSLLSFSLSCSYIGLQKARLTNAFMLGVPKYPETTMSLEGWVTPAHEEHHL